MQKTLGLFGHLTHKGNLKETRYGWLRLTPAYSVHLVSELLDTHQEKDPVVLDPFCGTGTTALVCAERGITGGTTDINPFLIWLARTKTRRYQEADLTAFEVLSERTVRAIRATTEPASWVPPLFQIEKWWDERTLKALSRAISVVSSAEKTVPSTVTDLLKIVFCRTMIDRANVSFAHQSMSFKQNNSESPADEATEGVARKWEQVAATVERSARSAIACLPRVLPCDARTLTTCLERDRYTCVITSPPYPNRMSYIRELRPYMYWLGYLQDARAAGELDWEAIGGTWGCATSYVGKWKPEQGVPIPYEGFDDILAGIAKTSDLLSRYVHKYFHDMVSHVAELIQVVRPGGRIHYIVGNSKFYEVMLPVEEIFAALFRDAGFADVGVRTIRKRTSKKELYEFVVSGQKPV